MSGGAADDAAYGPLEVVALGVAVLEIVVLLALEYVARTALAHSGATLPAPTQLAMDLRMTLWLPAVLSVSVIASLGLRLAGRSGPLRLWLVAGPLTGATPPLVFTVWAYALPLFVLRRQVF